MLHIVRGSPFESRLLDECLALMAGSDRLLLLQDGVIAACVTTQAEQFARRGLTFASGRPDLQASLWGLIAQAREKQGDAAGAALARQKAKVSL